MRGDLIFLAQASPLARSTAIFAETDPVARRWGRLDLEGSAILFLTSHAAVMELAVLDGAGNLLLVAGRREGAPALLPSRAEAAGWRTGWALGSEPGGGRVEVVLDPHEVLQGAVPGFEDRLRLTPVAPTVAPGTTGSRVEGEEVVVTTGVVSPGWEPPIAWTLARREEGRRLVGSVEALTGRLATTTFVAAAVALLTVALGLVALRQARRAGELEAENAYQRQLRELERRYAHNERLASVGRMAAGIAHEINNPLEGMANYLRLLEEDLGTDPRTADAADLASRVREGLDRIARITRQVLNLAAPGRGAREAVDLAGVVTSMATLAEQDPALEGVRLRLTLPQGPCVVEGDPTGIGQVLLNLLLNAAQAQPGGGEVEIRLESDAGSARLRVADRGPGLSQEDLQHIFEPFYSGRGSTGLGLAISRSIVEDHRGRLLAGNRPEGGAWFELELPRNGELAVNERERP
ncbi:MAG TPA: ATP-binding protein [Thermoanaerobaculia bacterium]|nr:ATP-binding protein [Thermoanaerobaculia bacterium]